MGVSVVVAAGLVALSLLSLTAAIQLQMISYAEALNEAFSVNRNLVIKNRWSIALVVESVSFSGQNVVNVRVVNVGALGISEREFKGMDVIIVYYFVNGTRTAEYLRYDTSGGLGTWRVSGVETSGNSGESLNPICPCPAAGKGVWDPGETLLIQSFLGSNADTTQPVNALVASPWGQYAYR